MKCTIRYNFSAGLQQLLQAAKACDTISLPFSSLRLLGYATGFRWPVIFSVFEQIAYMPH